ncbi:MAG: FecCD family ABC transporter permease [Roseburia sp.]
MRAKQNKRTAILVLFGVLLLFPALFLAISRGAMEIGLSEIWNAIFHYSESLTDMMIRDVRLPRVICALFTGGILGQAGAMMQGITRNPIAEPSLLGISQSATLAIACFYGAGIGVTTGNVMAAALFGAGIGGSLIAGIAIRQPGNRSITKLLLAGMAMSTFFSALTTVIGLLTNQAQMIAFWVSGGFRSASWTEAIFIMVVGSLGMIPAVLLSAKINVISLGDDTAISLGENPTRVRMLTLLLLLPLCAATVVVGKTIGFVGLIVPQIVRLFVGEDYRRMIPCSFLLGAVLLTYADIAARLFYAPYEIPVGIFTALLGVPFFLYMARKERG